MLKFSIITPQFNSFDLMGNYFISLENQSFKDFEVIIIDDCSTDDSFERLKEYVSNSHLNVTLRQTHTNSGPGHARNIGIEEAKGEWITFVDNDDWVEIDFLEKINNVIEKNDVNCVVFDYYIYKKGVSSHSKSMYWGEGGRKSLSDSIVSVRNHTFAKCYRLSECKDIKFPNIKRCEDVAYVCRAIDACGSVFYYDKPLYYYLQRVSSLSNDKHLDESPLIEAFSVLESNLEPKYPQEIKAKSVADLLYGVLLIMCKSGKSNKDIKLYIHKYEEKYNNWWKCDIINYLGIFKKVFLLMVRLHCIIGLKILSKLHTLMIK